MEKIKAVVCLVGFFCDLLFAIIKTLGCIINGSGVAPKLNGGIAMKGTIHFTRVLHTQPLRYEKNKKMLPRDPTPLSSPGQIHRAALVAAAL
jgi:hypothetical protein